MAIKKERADRAKNKLNYVKEILADPLRTDRELAEAIGVHHSTLQDIRKDTRQNPPESERIASLLEKDLEIQEKIAAKKLHRLQDPDDKINNSDLDKWESTALKRRQILTGWATERVEVSSFTPLQLQNIGSEILKASQQ